MSETKRLSETDASAVISSVADRYFKHQIGPVEARNELAQQLGEQKALEVWDRLFR